MDEETPEDKLQNFLRVLNRTLVEFESIVIISDVCYQCKELRSKRQVALVSLGSDFSYDGKKYKYIGCPICTTCSATFSSETIRDNMDYCLDNFEYTFVLPR